MTTNENTAKAQIPTVTVHVSKPYVKIAGGWAGMRPVGLRRDYRAEVFGHHLHNTSKAEIQRVIRKYVHRFTGSPRVQIEFVEEA